MLLAPLRTIGSTNVPAHEINRLTQSILSDNFDELFINGTRHYPDEKFSAESHYEILSLNHPVDWGFETYKNPRLIDVVIIHSTYNAGEGDKFSVSGVLSQFKNDGVTSNYLIDREGKILDLVPDSIIAFHAGESMLPDGRKNLNRYSVGIEIINSPDIPPDSSQYESLNLLLDRLEMKYAIKIITGHSDIAPDRKDDPWLFNWGKIRTGNSLLSNRQGFRRLD